MNRFQRTTTLVCLSLAISSIAQAQAITTYARGFSNPRGLKFGPNGDLYVAEGGIGGTESTVGQCDQVPEAGPYTGSATGSRVSKVSPTGEVSTVVANLPSSQTSPALGSLVSGVADVAFLRGQLYALVTGAGCSHGVAGTTNGVYRVDRAKGTATLVADLSAYYKLHPTANPEPEDFEPDGTPYSMVAARGALWVVEPNHGSVERVDTDGTVTRLVDVSATQGHVVPTSIAWHDGRFWVGNLGTFPIQPGTEHLYRISPRGRLDVAASGLTTVLGVAFDEDGRLYALENTTCTGPCFPTPFTGRVVRVEEDGSLTPVVTGLFLPTAMTFGPDGALYVSNVGFGPPPLPPLGEVLRIELPAAPED